MKKLRKKLRSHLGFVNILLVAIVILLGMALTGVFSDQKFKRGSGDSLVSSYTCCDSGDGAACKTSETEKFMWKGTNAKPEEYALLKSNIALAERAGHIDYASSPDDVTPKGDRIFINTSNVKFPNGYPDVYSPGSNDACQIPGQDFVFKQVSGTVCQGIPNDLIIYVCKSNCDAGIGSGKFDAYIRTSLGEEIPDVIKNCEKPANQSGQAGGGPTIVFEQQPERENLQLQTFKVKVDPGTTSWLSPYCKPAIYLYPKSTSYVSVKVNSSEPLTYTDPTYPANGWGVIAQPSGLINYRNKFYDYLYYETKVSDNILEKPAEGFVVRNEELKKLFADILPRLGLNIFETKQFSDYWIGVLPESNYYFVGIIPQTTLNSLTSLNIVPKPESIVRVTLYFEPIEQKISVLEPSIITPKRTGFTVAEWGGIYKKHPGEKFSCFM